MTLTKMKIFVAPDGSVKARVIGSARDIGMSQEYVSEYNGRLDVINVKLPFGALFNQAPITLSIATAAGAGGVGISGMKFVLAPEMTPSLASLTVLGLERDSAESAAQGSLGSKRPTPSLGNLRISSTISRITSTTTTLAHLDARRRARASTSPPRNARRCSTASGIRRSAGRKWAPQSVRRQSLSSTSAQTTLCSKAKAKTWNPAPSSASTKRNPSAPRIPSARGPAGRAFPCTANRARCDRRVCARAYAVRS